MVDTVYSKSVGGVWIINGVFTPGNTLNAILPLFTSQADLGNINDQSALTFTRADGTIAAAGSFINPYELDNQVDTVLVFPNWGIVGFPNTSYGGVNILNYKNEYAFPVYVDCTNNSMSSCKIYFDGVQQ